MRGFEILLCVVHALNIEVAERSSFDLVNEFGCDLSTREIPQF